MDIRLCFRVKFTIGANFMVVLKGFSILSGFTVKKYYGRLYIFKGFGNF